MWKYPRLRLYDSAAKEANEARGTAFWELHQSPYKQYNLQVSQHRHLVQFQIIVSFQILDNAAILLGMVLPPQRMWLLTICSSGVSNLRLWQQTDGTLSQMQTLILTLTPGLGMVLLQINCGGTFPDSYGSEMMVGFHCMNFMQTLPSILGG